MKKRIIVEPGGAIAGEIQETVFDFLCETAKDLKASFIDMFVATSIGAPHSSIMATGKYTCYEAHSACKKGMTDTFTNKRYGLPKCKFDYIEKMVDNYLGTDHKVGDFKTKLMITRESETAEKTRFVKSFSEHEGNYSSKNVIKSSIAATTFFEHVYCPDTNDFYCDGGEGINNNPAIYAYRQALRNIDMFDDWKEADIHILVIGTGLDGTKNSLAKVKRWRWLRSLMHFTDIKKGGLARRQSPRFNYETCGDLSKFSSDNIKFDYIDKIIPSRLQKFDDVKLLDELNEIGSKLAYENYDKICKFLED